MIPRIFNRCLLRPGDLSASQDDLKVIGAFNPGVVETPDGVRLLVRVAESVREQRPGQVALPRWDPAAGRGVVDWVGEDEVTFVDPRVVIVKRTGIRRLTFISHLQIARSRDGRIIDRIDASRFLPADENEEFGVEDPRITPLEGRFYFTYVAVSRHGAATALASTADFKTFARHGIIFPPENKDVVLFPEPIGGRFVALHRPNPAQHFSPPEMWLGTSPDLICWGGHTPFLGTTSGWDVGRVGGGTPPIRTSAGWLEIYHGNDQRPGASGVGRYSAGALLLDLENPRCILSARGQILIPETDYEREGFIPNVVFPTGIVRQGDTVLVYYGAADESCAVVEWRLQDLFNGI
jgi:predicted GH43/DUF377 family glycosyl hydrolase